MNTALARTIVQSLSFSREPGTEAMARLSSFNDKDWDCTLRWLDNSGLTLYLLRRIENAQRTSILPETVLTRLRNNQSDNRQRVMRMVEDFGRINRAFDEAGLDYAVMKGFSLVPEFCPDATLRAQSDLDYQVSGGSLPGAQRILRDMGYVMTGATGTQFAFRAPGEISSISANAFSVTTKPMVELHLAVWDAPNTSIPFAEPRLGLGRKQISEYSGVKFSALSSEDSFLLQVVHVFQHILCCWIRISWLLELGIFLDQRGADFPFWRSLEQRFRHLADLREFAAVVIGLTTRTFDLSFSRWENYLRPASRLWLENYGNQWLFADHPVHESSWFPANKLVLFLHQEYIADAETRKHVKRQRIFPWKRPPQTAVPDEGVSTAQATRLQLNFMKQRLSFHLGAGLRYAWELPRWRKLKRSQAA